MRVGFVGAGKVGFSLGCHLRRHGVAVSGYVNRTPGKAREAAHVTQSKAFLSLQALLESSDIVFITVPDDAIEDVAAEIAACAHDASRDRSDAPGIQSQPGLSARTPLYGKIVCHCSGLESSDKLAALRSAGAACASVHPLAAVNGSPADPRVLDEAFFTLEGDLDAVQAAASLLDACGNAHREISAADKPRYHAAAVFLSNLTCALSAEGLAILESCGFPPNEALAAMRPLFLNNCRAIADVGPVQALTGPIERGDASTCRAHLAVLDGRARAEYAALSLAACDLAEKRHPDHAPCNLRPLFAQALRESAAEPYSAAQPSPACEPTAPPGTASAGDARRNRTLPKKTDRRTSPERTSIERNRSL